MTSNHLLLYRLAELMLENEQHVLPVDLLFDDERIGDFVKSIQIDSPYQQMLFEGVLTETVKDEKLFVSFTVEGYFHYVLGEVIYNQNEGQSAEVLKQIVEDSNLNGAKEGVEQCLIREVQKDDLKRLMWLIDEGGKLLDMCTVPLANAFLNVNGNPKSDEEKQNASKLCADKILNELIAEQTVNDILVLITMIDKLESLLKYDVVKTIRSKLIELIVPNDIGSAILFLDAIVVSPPKYWRNKIQSILIDDFEELSLDYGQLILSYAGALKLINENLIAINYYKKAVDIFISLQNFDGQIEALNAIGRIQIDLGEYMSAMKSFDKAKKISTNSLTHAMLLFNTSVCWKEMGKYGKASKELKKSLEIRVKNFGRTHINCAITLNELGYISILNWELLDAEKNLVESVEIFNKIYTPLSSLEQSTSYSHLSSLYKKNNDYRMALEWAEKSLSIKSKLLPENDPSIGFSHTEIGNILKDLGEFDNAEINLRKALKNQISNYGEKHIHSSVCKSNLGYLLLKNNKINEGIDLIQSSISHQIMLNGENYFDLVEDYQVLGKEFSKQNLEKGLVYFDKAKNVLRKNSRTHANEFAFVCNEAGSILFAAKKYEKALVEFKSGIEIFKVLNVNIDTILYLTLINNAAESCRMLGMYQDCLFFYIKYLKIHKKNLNDTIELNNLRFQITNLLMDVSAFKEAKNILQSGFLETNAGGFAYKIGECCENLNEFNDALNYYLKAADLRKVKLGIGNSLTRQSIEKCLIVAQKLNIKSELPEWIKEFKNDV